MHSSWSWTNEEKKEEKKKEEEFCKVKVPGDNKCFFHCMQLALGLDSYLDVKAAIQKYCEEEMEEDDIMFLLDSAQADASRAKYLEEMNKPDYWGGALEQEIIRRIYNVEIQTFLVSGPSFHHEFKAELTKVPNVIYLLKTPIHYDIAARKNQDGTHTFVFERSEKHIVNKMLQFASSEYVYIPPSIPRYQLKQYEEELRKKRKYCSDDDEVKKLKLELHDVKEELGDYTEVLEEEVDTLKKKLKQSEEEKNKSDRKWDAKLKWTTSKTRKIRNDFKSFIMDATNKTKKDKYEIKQLKKERPTKRMKTSHTGLLGRDIETNEDLLRKELEVASDVRLDYEVIRRGLDVQNVEVIVSSQGIIDQFCMADKYPDLDTSPLKPNTLDAFVKREISKLSGYPLQHAVQAAHTAIGKTAKTNKPFIKALNDNHLSTREMNIVRSYK